MKKVIFTIIALIATNVCFSQKYFKPVIEGGLRDVNTNESYHLVKIEGKDSLRIYNALMTMIKNTFQGDEDEILKANGSNYIKVKGVAKRALCTYYDIRLEIEFRIKNGRYIYSYTKMNLVTSESKNGKTKKLIIGYGGSNLFRKDTDTEFLLNKKGKATVGNKLCYKHLIQNLDLFGSIFDISKNFKKLEKIKEKEDKGW